MPKIDFRAASRANYTVANRPTSAIRKIVVHVTESSALSAITWFTNARARASAHYVVSGTGGITQMVRDSDIAWHAGDWATNRESIGIEHEGYTYRKGTISDAEYRASALLVGYEMRRYLLPIDRKHIIGHSDVPDPNHPGQHGGADHHTDPGPYWQWPRYLTLVRAYARGNAPKLVLPPAAKKAPAKPSITAKVNAAGKVSVSSSGLQNGQTVEGYVKWRAAVTNADVTRVDFLVDGRLRWSEKEKPFEFGGDGGWDTTREANGVHVLTLRVVTKKGATAGQSLRVTVANNPFEIATAAVSNGQTVKGKVRWEAVPSGANADHVDFLVDGKLVHTEKSAPYTFDGDWDTTKVDNGAHTLALRAVAVDGRVAESSVTVLVANPAPPKPKPTGSSISIVMKGVFGQVSGVVRWEGVVSGGRPDRVEFWIDGRWRWTQRSAPYAINWDTTREQAGTHVLSVRALGGNGLVYDVQTITTTVQSRLSETAAPAPTTMALGSSVADGASVKDGVAWTATVTGATPDRVEFYVDGKLLHTERSAPYEFGTWDTTQEQNGPHVLMIRAIARDGKKTELTQNVVVANSTPDLAVTSSIADAQTVSGTVTWSATTSGPAASKVEFLVDGVVRRTDTSAPYTFAWDTTLEKPGAHALLVKAYAGTRVAQQSLSATVANAMQSVAISSQTLSNGQVVSGGVTWTVRTGGATPDKVEYWIDGILRYTDTSSPHAYAWDTKAEKDGVHALVSKAYAGTQVVQKSISVTVRNTPIAIATQSLTDGQSISGSLTWTVTTSGATPDKIEYWIDGSRRHTERSAPYEYAWNTTDVADGAHTLVTKAYAGSQVDQKTLTVTVKNAAAPAPAPAPAPALAIASQSLSDGQTVSGSLTWTVTTSGPTPDKVEYWIDGKLRHTEQSAPYEFAWDTKADADGAHALVVKAYAGTIVQEKSLSVTVKNTAAPKVAIVSQTLADGQSLAGTVTWLVTVSGPVQSVQLLIDGLSAGVFTAAPYGGTLDTKHLANGAHTFVTKVTGTDSSTANATIAVTVANS